MERCQRVHESSDGEGTVTWSCVYRLALREKPEFKVWSGRHMPELPESIKIELQGFLKHWPRANSQSNDSVAKMPCTAGTRRHKTLAHPPSIPILLTLPGSSL